MWREPPQETVEAVLAAMGAETDAPEAGAELVLVRAGQRQTIDRPVQLVTEDGASMRLEHEVPDDLPPGYYQLRDSDDGIESVLAVTPGRCHLPPDLDTWGWAVQLYAVRSGASWGMGDLGDLTRLARWSRRLGAGALVLNPLHAALPTVPQEPSPYSPSSRRFRNPLYLRIENVPGAAHVPELGRLAAAGRALNGDRRIDRDRVWSLKREALGQLWHAFPESERFEAFCRTEGDLLTEYATFSALAEELGRPWREWPAEYRHPANAAVARFAEEYRDRVRFHQWLQWLLDEQLGNAGETVPLVHDLAIGAGPDGADAWMWQDVFAEGMSAGAPPDVFNRAGQDWGLPPFDPWRLRAAGYRPFIETLRSTFRHGGGIRVDHVMGLFRLFWIPEGGSPADGTYVSYPNDDLLDLLALESQRAQAFVIGEDLGTVQPEVRDELAERHVLSYRLLWFEPGHPRDYPRQALAAVTTHDLPTITGLWTGADLDDQRAAGLEPNEEGTAEIKGKLRDLTGLSGDATPEEVVLATSRVLAEAPAMVVTATLDDALAVRERPNMPGTTTDSWPNWSLALPVPLEEVERDDRATAIAVALSGRPTRSG